MWRLTWSNGKCYSHAEPWDQVIAINFSTIKLGDSCIFTTSLRLCCIGSLGCHGECFAGTLSCLRNICLIYFLSQCVCALQSYTFIHIMLCPRTGWKILMFQVIHCLSINPFGLLMAPNVARMPRTRKREWKRNREISTGLMGQESSLCKDTLLPILPFYCYYYY